MSERLVKIYGLRDSDQNLRYVGKTVQTLHARLTKHWSDSRLRGGNHLRCWLWSLPQPPTIELIAVVPEASWEQAERDWIARAKSLGCDLVNGTAGGYGQLGKPLNTRQRTALQVARMNQILTPESSERRAAAQRGKKHSLLTRQRMSEAHRGSKKPKLSECALRSFWPSRSTTGFKGVSFHKSTQKFRAYFSVAGKQQYLGLFDTAEEAARVRDYAVLKHCPLGAFLNFPFILETE